MLKFNFIDDKIYHHIENVFDEEILSNEEISPEKTIQLSEDIVKKYVRNTAVSSCVAGAGLGISLCSIGEEVNGAQLAVGVAAMIGGSIGTFLNYKMFKDASICNEGIVAKKTSEVLVGLQKEMLNSKKELDETNEEAE